MLNRSFGCAKKKDIEDTKYAIENVLALMCQKGCRQILAYAGIEKLILFVFFLDILLLRKNRLLILLLWTTTRCAVMNILLQRRLERP